MKTKEEIELIGEVSVEKKAAQNTDTYQKELGYIQGYNQALEDNKKKKYTEEELKNIWNKSKPLEKKSYICRMNNAYIKMCYWNGSQWFDMWKPTLDGEVKEWIEIPYDKII